MNEVQTGTDSVGVCQLESSNGNGNRYSPGQVNALLAALAEPFDSELVEWRVTNTAPSKHGYRGQVVAYADQRAYTDRLNALFTPLGWTRDYSVQTVQNFERPAPGQAKTTVITAKVMVTCKVAIFGLGAHSGTGEEWATDENALTRAEGIGSRMFTVDNPLIRAASSTAPVREGVYIRTSYDPKAALQRVATDGDAGAACRVHVGQVARDLLLAARPGILWCLRISFR